MSITDTRATVIFINQRLSEMLGYLSEEITGKCWLDMVPVEQQAIAQEAEARRANGLTDRYEIVLCRKNGEKFPVLIGAGPRFDKQSGQYIGSMGVVNDITERKQTEEILKESETAVRKKLKAIMEPQSDLGELELADIIDVPAVQSLMEKFHQITGMLSAIVDSNGKVLVEVGWQDICIKFHRCHPETHKNCVESDLFLSSAREPGGFSSYRCKNGMWDMSTPIVVSGYHMGNIYFGQFIYSDEKLDVERFRSQARRYGFDEAEYLDALNRIPRYDRETVEEVMAFYSGLGMMISALSFSNVRLSRTLTEQKRAEKALKEKTQLLQNITDNMFDLVSLTDMEGNFTFLGASHKVLNYDLDSLIGKNVLEFVHPDDLPEISSVFHDFLFKLDDNQKIDYRYRCADGTYLWLETVGRFIRDDKGNPKEILFSSRDITDRKRMEEALREREERFRLIFNMGVNAMFLVDDNTTQILECNNKASQLFGYSVQELVTMKMTDLSTTPEATRRACQEKVSKKERVYQKKDGRLISVDITSEHFYLANRAVHISAIRDITEKKLAEVALREKTKLLQNIIATTSDLVAVTDMEGNFTFLGPSHRFLGYDPDLLIGRNVMELVHPDDFQETATAFAEFLTNREDGRKVEYRYRRADGDYLWFETVGKFILDDAGNPKEILFSSRDFTERKQVEEALIKSEKDLKQSQRIALLGSWRLDLITNQVEWTEELYRMYGFDPTMPPPPYTEHMKLFTPESWERLSTSLSETATTGMPYELELETVREDGSNGWMWVRGEAVNDAAGNIIGLWGAAQDITERKRAEEELRENENILNITGQMAKIGGWELYPETMKVTWTAETYRIHEVSKSIKPPLDDAINFWHPEDQPILRKAIQQAIDNGIPYDLELRFITAKGRNLYARTKCNPVLRNGKVVKLQGFFHDITDRKQAEKERDKLQSQLLQAQKMESVGRLAGGVAHDFNNMLGVILGHLELAMEKAEQNHDLYDDLNEIQNAANRSVKLTKQLLTFARKDIISPKKIDLNDTVESMLNMLRRLIGEDIDLVWQPAAHLWPVKMDPSQIDQILANLCVNARDAISGVGKLTIETGRKTFDEEYCNEHPGFIPGDFVLLAVSDNGCGMDKETLENLFEPFFTTKEVGKGTGLGLATIYGIVKQNNGFINVYSEPGQGSTFKIYLPRLVADEDADKAVPEKKAAAGGTETILLVEDEPTILRMTRMMLERKGYSVLSAATPGEAIDLAKTHADKIHLLMTDVVMPEMNGRDLARTNHRSLS
ncbi:MAG: PAS domain S-box protein [Desulfotignum sp.]|nr:PAS domain S-box protein [Desulfotignum sp.]